MWLSTAGLSAQTSVGHRGGAGPAVALLEEGEVVLVGLGNSSSWIPVLDFRPICERGQWFSIYTFAESCVRAGLERV